MELLNVLCMDESINGTMLLKLQENCYLVNIPNV